MYKISSKINFTEIDCRRKNSSRDENPKMHLPGRLTLVTDIGYSNDAAHIHTQEVHSGLQIYKITRYKGICQKEKENSLWYKQLD